MASSSSNPAPRPVEVEIVTVGNELLLGETVDTNSPYLARRLAAVGARVTRVTVVGDDRARLAAALREARGRSNRVITMGGLGPTRDDVTREVVAETLGRPLRLDPDQLKVVEGKFRRFGYETMPPSNQSQAMVPEGARVIPNAHGTAPGLVIEEEEFTLYVLPGVPHEMKAMVEDVVVPELAAAAGEGAGAVRSRVIRTVGIGESALAERIDDVIADAAPIEVAFLPHLGQVDLRLTAAGLRDEESEERIGGLTRRIVERAGKWVYGFDGDTLAGAIGHALLERGWKVGVAESCTAGELGAEITSEAGSSAWFVGGVVAYANEVKERLLGVPPEILKQHGAVSEATCRSMASGVRAALAADVGCAITGVAGPGGGTEDKPVGLVWCGVDSPEGFHVRRLDVPGARAEVRRRAVVATLALLLRAARGEGAA
jgi:nicotinamide-nucleotide amidase